MKRVLKVIDGMEEHALKMMTVVGIQKLPFI
jgi:hypothetical protein